jgi:ribosomal protein L32
MSHLDTSCERCHTQPAPIPDPAGGPGVYPGMHDYCVYCSKNLCPACMEAGRCGESRTGKHLGYESLPECPSCGEPRVSNPCENCGHVEGDKVADEDGTYDDVAPGRLLP